jgi:hypothetical protein
MKQNMMTAAGARGNLMFLFAGGASAIDAILAPDERYK